MSKNRQAPGDIKPDPLAPFDWFIPVKPGSDTALALCMANQIVQRKEYDREFMTKYTVAPLLVDVSTGKFATSGDKFLYWDEDTQS